MLTKRELGLKEIVIGVGITSVLSALFFLLLVNLYIYDFYEFIEKLSVEELKSYLIIAIKIQMLFGFTVLTFGSGYIMWSSHIAKLRKK